MGNGPLDLQGTDFQIAVWQALRAIPFGDTRSYGEVARMIGRPTAARAVGGAVGTNRIAILVPCHRALPADGGIGGFAWGETRKRALLDAEKN